MVKISIDEDCNNAPKKQFVKDFNIAFAKGDTAYLSNCLSEDIHWDMIGDRVIEGKEGVVSFLQTMNDEASELRVDNIISHGDRCSANGTLTYEDGSKVAFCDVYVFTSHGSDAKIKSLVSYDIEL